MNIDKFTNKITSKNLQESLPNEVKLMQSAYQDFVNKINKTDFANSPRRYMIELNYLKQLLQTSQKYNVAVEVEKIQTQIDEILLKLEHDFGITLKK